MAEIYGLFSAQDGKVRYVGQTFRTRDVRFKEHPRIGSDHVVRPVYQWMHREWKAGFPVHCALLEMCSDAAADVVEREWISRFPKLLNKNKRANYWRHCKPPEIPEITEYRRRFVFNSGGYRGIHWWRQLDRYSVFFYDGHDWEWLPGDGAAHWDAEIWFTDRNDALKARERHRRGRPCTWLGDIEQEVDW